MQLLNFTPSATRCKVSTEGAFIGTFKGLHEYRVHENLIGRRILADQDLPGGGLQTFQFAGYNTCPKGQTSRGHWHRSEELWYIDKGSGWWRDGGGNRRPLAAGDVIYVPRDSFHEVSADEEDLHVWCVGSSLVEEPWPEFWSSHLEPADRVTQTPGQLGEPNRKEVLGVALRAVNHERSTILPVSEAVRGEFDDGVVERVVVGTGSSGRLGWPGATDILHVTMNTLEPNSAMRQHWHYYEELMFVVSGEAKLRDADDSLKPIRAGDTIFVPPNSPHSVIAGAEPSEILSIGARVPGGRPDTEVRFTYLEKG